MTDDNRGGRADDGFEYQGRFYRWRCSDLGKDLILIDRISEIPITEFFDRIEDAVERERGPVLLSLIATSIRAGHPDWTIERIHRTVLNLNLSDVVFVDADQEEEPQAPLPVAAVTPPPGGGSSTSPANGSSSSSTQPATSTSQTSSATPP